MNAAQSQGSKTGADGLDSSLPSLSASYEEVGTCDGTCGQFAPTWQLILCPVLAPPVVSFKPEPPLSTELSTILESDLSGLSKHIPALDESQISDVSGNGHSIKPEALSSSPEINELVAPDASVLDLSTSQLKEEVMHALKEKPSTNGWLAGVVVEDAADSRPTSRNDRKELEFDIGEEPEESLHLDALDSDLAALLGSNRSAGKRQSLFRSENPFTSTQIPQQPHAIVPPRIFPPTRTVTPQPRPSPLASSPVDASPSSTIGSTRSQHSPVRTTASHGYSSLPRSASSRFMPRLMRSVTDRATPVREDRNVENAARTPSDTALPIDDTRRVSIDSVYQRLSPASPVETQPPLPPLPHPEPHRRVATSRLATPARFGAHAPASSRLLRAALPPSSSLPGTWDKDSPSPSSRASSALGSATERLVRPRTSEDGVLENRLTARERLGYAPRNRNRSLSVGGGKNERVTSPAPRSTEWLGPRTAKAFAAAGLLDRDVSNNNASRFGSVRSLGDRDQRTLAPSRLAASEAGSVAGSWRSVSRAMTHSEATGHDSASTSTGAPRTTRSAESTAPTSISLSCPQSRTPSPQHKNYQAALQAMQEKHTTETGTLLAALADAQQNTQSLRAENAKLVARIENLESELVEARAQLRAHQYASSAAVAMPPPTSTPVHPYTRAVFSRKERQASVDAVAITTTSKRRPPLPLPGHMSGHPQASNARVADLKRLEDADEDNSTFQVGGIGGVGGGGGSGGRLAATAPSRRASWSESVFAVPPPNMSMLLQELPAGSRHSVGSISMTTASAPTDAPGSPRSLFLRPEHELHLGDLGSLDMRFTEDEADDVGDDDSAF